MAFLVAGMNSPEIAEAAGFLTATTIDAALLRSGDIVGRPAGVLVVPHALLTLPIVAD